MSEKRLQARARSFLKGRIVFSNKATSVDCVVRNISDTGAKLHVSESVTIPEQFELYIPQRDETLRARLKWRREDEVGVAFLTAGKVDEPSPDVSARLRELEAENALLKKLLAEMKGENTDREARRAKAG